MYKILNTETVGLLSNVCGHFQDPTPKILLRISTGILNGRFDTVNSHLSFDNHFYGPGRHI